MWTQTEVQGEVCLAVQTLEGVGPLSSLSRAQAGYGHDGGEGGVGGWSENEQESTGLLPAALRPPHS